MHNADGTNRLSLLEYLLAGLDRQATEPVNRQLYRLLRAGMINGQIAHGSPLPSSRALAQDLQIARNTVLHAYEQLAAEGYVQTRKGAGTFVCYAAEPSPATVALPTESRTLPKLSRRASGLLTAMPAAFPLHLAFAPGMPDLQAFPWSLWQKLSQQAQRAAPPDAFGYASAGGHPALRAALANYLRLSRGVQCSADNVLITGGMQQSFGLIASTLADAGDKVWHEEPGYNGARMAWLANGLQIEPMPVDTQGLQFERSTAADPRLIYVTPSHQYPLGSVMSLPRRLALLAEAAKRDAWIVEDDYDSEFRHTGRPLAALQGLDTHGRVIYLGTFSKVMFPALRLSYLVAPPCLVDPLCRLQARLWRESSYHEQIALAQFIDGGHFTSHLRRMRQIYAERQHKLRSILAEHVGDWPIHGGDAGMHLTLQLPDGMDDNLLSQDLAAIGIVAPALASYCHATPPFPGLVLGYAGVADDALIYAAVRLGRRLADRHNQGF